MYKLKILAIVLDMKYIHNGKLRCGGDDGGSSEGKCYDGDCDGIISC